MKYIIAFLEILVSSAVLNGIIIHMRKEKHDNTNLVRLPKIQLTIGIIESAVFIIPVVSIIVWGDERTQFLALFFSLFSLLGVSLIIGYINCRIVFNEEYFVYKNFFGIKKTITYKDLTGIQGNKKDVKLYSDKGIVRVDEFAVNNEKFLSMVKSQYKLTHGGLSLPKNEKKDLFNNHLESPGEFIFVYVMLAVLLLSFTIWVCCLAHESISDYSLQNVVVERYEISDNDLFLYNEDNEKFILYDYTECLNDPEALLSALNQNKEFELLIKYNGKGEEPFYIVSQIVCGTEQYLLFESYYKNQRKNFFEGFSILLFLDLLWGAFVCFSIYIARNPYKFSDRVLHMFFKPGYIHRD